MTGTQPEKDVTRKTFHSQLNCWRKPAEIWWWQLIKQLLEIFNALVTVKWLLLT